MLGAARVTSQVHPNARKHPSGATTTGGLWASPFALHALAVLPHGSRLGRFRGVSAALRRFNTSRAVVARAYPSMRGAAGCDQVPSPGTAAALGQLGAGQSDFRSKAGSGISSTDLSTCNRVLGGARSPIPFTSGESEALQRLQWPCGGHVDRSHLALLRSRRLRSHAADHCCARL